ncbi:MAG: ABC transporter ATP-binding protein, partial [Halodesulfurarchaeum sp.]
MDVSPPDDAEVFEAQRAQVRNPMRRLFGDYGRESAGAFAVGFGASVVARTLDLLPPLMLGIAIDAVFLDRRPFELPLVPRAWLPTETTAQFWFVVGVIAASFAGAAVCHYLRNWGWNAFAQHVQHTVRVDTYDRMQHLDMAFFEDKQTGELMSVLSNDVNRLERFLNDGMNSASRLGLMVVGIAALLLWLNPQLAVIALLPVPVVALFTYRFVKRIQPKYADVRSTVGQVNSRLENNLGGISVIKAANTEGYEADRVEAVSRD